jgi:DNA mismatch repair protein MutL
MSALKPQHAPQADGGTTARPVSTASPVDPPRRAIHVLPAALADRIAAGEVVERPASVVKELVENSLDAGATVIEVQADEAGVKALIVADNGAGIPADELRVAVVRHATSKIQDPSDLDAIRTLGFRGEALPSIAAVSKMAMTSRPPDADTAMRLELHGSHEVSFGPVGAPLGTRIEVRELFYNTPARRKFMRTAATERAHILETLTRIALAVPHVHFKLVFDGRVALDLPSGVPLAQRAVHALGREYLGKLHPFDGGIAPIRVWGLLAPPEISAGSQRMMYAWLNGRFVRDRAVSKAMMDAYQGMLPRGRYPVALVFLEMPFDKVDINVHPQKFEVRFAPDLPVHPSIMRAMGGGLIGAGATKRNDALANLAAVPTMGGLRGIAADRDDDVDIPVGIDVPDGSSEANQREFEAQRDRILKVMGPGGGRPTVKSYGLPAGRGFSSGNSGSAGGAGLSPRVTPTPTQIPGRLPFGAERTTPVAPIRSGEFAGPTQREAGLDSEHTALPFGDAALGAAPVPSETREVPFLNPPPGGYASLRVVGQLGGVYILCELPNQTGARVAGDDGGLIVIDMHAAHERVTYTKLLDTFYDGGAVSQPLLIPQRVTLSPAQVARVEALGPELEKFGIVAEPFGDNAIQLSAVPAWLMDADWPGLMADMAHDLEDVGSDGAFREAVRQVVARMACHSSVRAGDRLSPEECRALLRQMDETALSSRCPHGRPVAVHVRWSELERWFHRH